MTIFKLTAELKFTDKYSDISITNKKQPEKENYKKKGVMYD